MSTNVEKHTPATQQNDLSPAFAKLTVDLQRFVHMYLTGQYTIVTLAKLLEVHPNTVSNWLRRKDVKEAIAEYQTSIHAQVETELKSMTLKAIEKLGKLINSPIDGVALNAVKDVLDRAGHKQKQEIKIDKTVTTIEQQMKQLAEITIVDADFEEVTDE